MNFTSYIKKKMNILLFLILLISFITHFFLSLEMIQFHSLSGDETDDIEIIRADIKSYSSFFTSSREGLDQARLPFILSIPFLTKDLKKTLIRLRVFFYIFHIAYIILSFFLIKEWLNSKIAQLVYVILLTTSSWFQSYSFNALTTGDSAYLFFHLLAIYIFWKQFKKGELHPFSIAFFAALATASKFFGMFLIPPFIFLSFINIKNISFSLQSINPKKSFIFILIFLFLLFGINIIYSNNIMGSHLSIFMAFSVILFSLRIIYNEIYKKKNHFNYRLSFKSFWIYTLSFYIIFTFCLSPIHMNLENVLLALGWFSKWNTGDITTRSFFYDPLVTLVIKYGIYSFIITLPLIFYYSFKRNKQGHFSILITSIFILHFIIISTVNHRLTFYTLAIFPFLYLPIICGVIASSKKIRYLSFIIITVLVFDNSYRYYKWYPYVYLDGAQYGIQHIGWNKSSTLLTFEAIPELIDFFKKKYTGERITISYNIFPIEKLNFFFEHTLFMSFEYLNGKEILHRNSLIKENPSFIITSPVYNKIYKRDLAKKLLERGYTKEKVISIKNIETLAIWEKDIL